MAPLPDEYDGFNPRYLAYDEPWIIILVETLRYNKAFPDKTCIGEYELKKRSNKILLIASDGAKDDFGGSYQSYMKRFSNKNPYTNEKYYTRKTPGRVCYEYKIDLIEQRIKAEKVFSTKNYTAILRKHGIFGSPDKGYVKKYSSTEVSLPPETVRVSDMVGFEVRDAKGKIKKIG